MTDDSGRVPGGIGQQVDQHLHDAAAVGHDLGKVEFNVDVNVVAATPAQEGVPGPVHQDGHF